MLTNNDLRILQNNLHKSQTWIHSILNHPDTKQFAVLLLQEQYWSSFTKTSTTHSSWTLYEPTILNNENPRSSIYVNNNFISAAHTTHIDLPLNDVTAIEITTKDPYPTPHARRSLEPLPHKYTTIIIAGDFNSHHPYWNPSEYTRHDEEADTLMEMITELELDLLIPAGTVTYPKAGTAIDLVWGNDEAKNRTIKCQIAEKNDHAFQITSQ